VRRKLSEGRTCKDRYVPHFDHIGEAETVGHQGRARVPPPAPARPRIPL
jgi:hypothetical protein